MLRCSDVLSSREDLQAADAAGTEDMVHKLDIFEALHEVLCVDKAAPEGQEDEEKAQEVKDSVVKLSAGSNRCHLNILKRLV